MRRLQGIVQGKLGTLIRRLCRSFAPSPGLLRVLARVFAPGAVYHLLMLAAFLAVFALIPLTLYMHSGEAWRFTPVLLLKLASIGVVFFLCAAALVRSLAAVHTDAAIRVAIAIHCLGLFAVVAHVYAPVPIGPLDGSEVASSEPLVYSAVEVLLLALFLLASLHLARGRGLRTAGWFSALLLLATGGYLVAAMPSATGEQAHHRPRGQAAAPPPGNVYHIVLDTLQTDAFLAALAHRPELVGRLPGFVLFQNNISNYTTTRSSAASYFTSTFYDRGDYNDWVWNWRKKGLLKELSQAGYQIWMYAPFGDWTNRFADHYWYNVDIYEREIGGAGTAFYDFLHIWLVSLAPNALTNEALDPAGALRDRLWRWMVGPAVPLSSTQGKHPYAGVLMLSQLPQDEDRRPADGQYVYAHAALPHGPWVMDPSCRYAGKPEGNRRDPAERQQAYVEQTECALLLLEGFLNRLVELGRYDPATIVVHADTGHGVDFKNGVLNTSAGGSTLGKDDGTLLSLVNALLMIKQPRARAPFAISAAPSQLVDLLPTLLDVLKLEAPPYPMRGTSVHSLRDDERRDALFGLDPKKKHGSSIVEVRIEDPSDLQSSKLTVLGPATDPATWRAADKQSPRRAAGSPSARASDRAGRGTGLSK